MEPLDRLSELPDSLIFVIFSFLPMRDVVRTTFLSKRWRDVWITVEYLDFWDEYCHFICGAVAQWKGAKIHELSLGFHDDDPPSFHVVDSLLRFGVEKQVGELNVYLGPNMPRKYRLLPLCLYSCSSITKLSLCYSEIKIQENIVQWNQLKSLTIGRSTFLNEYDLSQILCGAPLLEELNLWSFTFSKSFCILSTSLKKLQIGTYETGFGDSGSEVLRILAPNLLTLDISGFFCRRCLLDVPSLTNAILYFQNLYGTEIISSNALLSNQVFRSICHVEKVTLSDRCIKFLVYMKKKDMAVQFSHAYSLKLYDVEEANEMLDVLEIFPKLMVLNVDGDNKDGYSTRNKESHIAKKRKMTFPSPSLLQLKTVKICWSLHDTSVIRAIEIMLQNAHLLEEMVFRPTWFGDHQEMLLMAEEKVLSMPRSSQTAEVIIMK